MSVPTFANNTLVTSVNGWIVIQQRVDGSQDFNLPWNDYKSGFGVFDKNFWLGLEKMHKLTTSADYRLRFEVLMASGWVSDEYDHFKVNSELQMYSLVVFGYSGDNEDVLNSPYNALMIQNGMQFTTFDKDNDLAPTENCAAGSYGGNWYKNCYLINLNGVYGSSLYYFKVSKNVPVIYCRMMIKLNI
ncbi:hypothetical protein HELRODRAFT_81646 [Helobdella robusta]|uniref:Fibrinogen C-terminal domain-containing protein n=1 Tax=Helobdella robusta TaxID=6412 RepID=T1G4G9_HELRO|nr:hypothetical protein HELRODRAFT_81646 [Helobdella robusta]ESO01715.1 hypothetical protein HELRODRAFT_81646 [Helobdella robusta]